MSFRDIENFMRKIKKKEDSFINKFVELRRIHQIWVALVAFISTVLVWRGVHNLLEMYWFSQYDPLFSSIIAISVGLLIIASTHYAVKKI